MYVDDKVVIAEIERQVQKVIHQINSIDLKYGIKINAGKTKVMKFTNDQEIENINEFRLLGALMNSDGRDLQEIKTRAGTAKNAFINLNQMLDNQTMNLDPLEKMM